MAGMITRPEQPRGQQIVGRLAIGVAVGVLVALLTSYVPVVAILVIGAVLVASWAVLVRGRRDEQSASLVGIVLGAGLALLYGAVTTITACSQTDTFCGNANVMPLLAFALVAAISGVVSSLVIFRARR